MKVSYEGIFFDRDEVLKLAELIGTQRLTYISERPHVTIKISPKKVSKDYAIGEKVKCEIYGYGNNGKSEGVLVRLPEDKPGSDRVLYMTISKDEEAMNADTRLLAFVQLPQPVYLEGTFQQM